MDIVGLMERMSEVDIDEEMQISTIVEMQNEENFEDEVVFDFSIIFSLEEEGDKLFLDSEDSVYSEDSVFETESE